MNLTAIRGPLRRESCERVGISTHVDLDEGGWDLFPMVISDEEGNEGLPSVVFVALQRALYGSRSWAWYLHCCCRVLPLECNWYPSGLLTSSRLTSASSSAYAHPLGSFALFDSWVGWQNRSGILTDRIEGSSELSN